MVRPLPVDTDVVFGVLRSSSAYGPILEGKGCVFTHVDCVALGHADDCRFARTVWRCEDRGNQSSPAREVSLLGEICT